MSEMVKPFLYGTYVKAKSENIKPLLYGTYLKPKKESVKPMLFGTYWSPYPQAVGRRFDGTAYVTLPAILSGRNVFTVEMVISTKDTRGGDNWNSPHFFGFQTGGANSRDFGIGVSNGQAFIQEGLGIVNDNIKGAYIADGAAHRLTAVCDGKNAVIALYVDGVESLSYAIGTSTVANHAVYIGYGSLNSFKTSMILYDLRIWGKAIQESEIGAEIDGTEADLLAWYNCNEPAFTLIDNSGHGNDGTINGRLITIWGAKNTEVTIRADLKRTPGIGVTLHPDTVRDVRRSVSLRADISRRLSANVNVHADAIRYTGKKIVHFDAERIVATSFRFDAVRTVTNSDYRPVGERFDGSNYVELPPFLATRKDYTVEATGSSGLGMSLAMLSDLMKLFLMMIGNAPGGDYIIPFRFPMGGDGWEMRFNGVTYRFHDRVIDQRVDAGVPFNLAAAFTCTGDASGFLDMFFNGMPMGSFDVVVLSDDPVPLTIGQGADPEHVIDVYNLTVWNTARNADEVARDVTGGEFNADELKDILALYDFSSKDPTNVTLVIDTRSGHNGTVKGGGEVKTIYGMQEPFVPLAVEIHPDTLRRVVLLKSFVADTLRLTGKRTLAFDAYRKVCKALAIPFDARRDIPHIVNVEVSEPIAANTPQQRASIEISHGIAAYTFADGTKAEISEGQIAVSSGGIVQTSVGRAVLQDGTVIELSHGDIAITYADGIVEVSHGVFPAAASSGRAEISHGVPWREPRTTYAYPAAEELSDGLQSITVNITEGQLWDNCQMVLARGNIGINEAVSGHIFDYDYTMLAENTSTTGIMETVGLMTSVDEILYRSIKYSAGNEKRKQAKLESIMKTVAEKDDKGRTKQVQKDSGFKRIVYEEVNTGQGYLLASVHAAQIASALGLQLVARFDDFTPNISVDEDGMVTHTTYQAIMQQVFGWTSEVPHRYIHFYIRKDTLYIIQRGKESNTVDLSECKCTVHTTERRLLRTAWSDDADDSSKLEHLDMPENLDYSDAPEQPNANDYVKELPLTVTYMDIIGAGDSAADYPEYTERQCGTKKIESHYDYERKSTSTNMTREIQTITDEDGNKREIEVIHGDSGYDGWNVVGAKEVGGEEEECLGSMLVRKHSDDTITSYENRRNFMIKLTEVFAGTKRGMDEESRNAYNEARKEYMKAYQQWLEEHYEQYQAAIQNTLLEHVADSINQSILYTGNEKVFARFLELELKAMNRKTEETITVTVYDLEHIIDYDDKIIFNGATYFLQSNTFTRNATTVNQQDLHLIRWV